MKDLKEIKGDVTESIWKWRCKIAPPQRELSLEKPLDLDSVDSHDGQNVPAKDPGFGADAVIKTMYEGRNSSRNEYEWVDYPPKQLSKSATRAQERVAIKLYKIKDREKPCIAGRYPLKYYMIEVQNSTLVAALEPILKKEAMNLDINEPAKFEEPFSPLWFCQDDIIALYKATDDAKPLKQYLKLFVRVLDDMFGEMRIKKKHQLASGLIEFSSAWTLFPRGSVVYTHGLNSESLCKVESTKYEITEEGRYLSIKAKFLVFNGSEFIWKEKVLPIRSFQGKKQITELEHCPFDLQSQKEDIKKRLSARGKRALDYQGLRYCCYNGLALQIGECATRHNVEGRVLIDVVGYNKFHLTQGKRENSNPRIERQTREKYGESASAVKSNGRRLTEKEELKNKEDMLEKEEDLCFMSELIGGYALKNKEWRKNITSNLLMTIADNSYSSILHRRHRAYGVE
jgi:sRNA-binding protein